MHGAFGIGRHQNKAIACRMVGGVTRCHRKGHAQIREAVLKNAPQLVIANLADKTALHAKPCQPATVLAPTHPGDKCAR